MEQSGEAPKQSAGRARKSFEFHAGHQTDTTDFNYLIAFESKNLSDVIAAASTLGFSPETFRQTYQSGELAHLRLSSKEASKGYARITSEYPPPKSKDRTILYRLYLPD